MILVTTQEIPGKTIKKNLGLVRGNTIDSMGEGADPAFLPEGEQHNDDEHNSEADAEQADQAIDGVHYGKVSVRRRKGVPHWVQKLLPGRLSESQLGQRIGAGANRLPHCLQKWLPGGVRLPQCGQVSGAGASRR